MKKCSQCNSAAIMVCDGHLLCLSCSERLERIQAAEFARNAATLNMLAAQMEQVVPFAYSAPRLQIPRPALGPVAMTNINIEKSHVGVVNTGTINHLTSSLRYIREQDGALSDQLTKLTQAVLESKELANEAKRELIELVTAITDDMTASPEAQKPAVRTTLMKRVGEVLRVSASLGSLWSAACATMQTFGG